KRRDDIARGLRIRRLPAPRREIGVPGEAEGARDTSVRGRIMGPDQPRNRCHQVRLVLRVCRIPPEPLAPSLPESSRVDERMTADRAQPALNGGLETRGW